MNLAELKTLFRRAGATKLLAKTLADNDNSKNQVYFGSNFQILNLLPNEGIFPDSSPKNQIFKARLRFGWLTLSGEVAPAPGAQLILYPQYPEVRFSGFLKGCPLPPSDLMTRRQADRILFLGVSADRKVIGFVAGPDSDVAADFRKLVSHRPAVGVFTEIGLPSAPDERDSRTRLLEELRRIHMLHWIDSKQLDANGEVRPCHAPQCGGFTLEAELGIPKNSDAEPDYLGWEVKQHSVPSFGSVGGAITLMTPEPNGGVYKEEGVETFIRKFGYEDRRGRADRLNFGGIHKVGEAHGETGLTMQLIGYDHGRNRISDANGSIALTSSAGEIAASWAFSSLLAHWSRKHSKAAYVPSMKRTEPRWQYAYGDWVRLGERTDPLRLLSALASGKVYYDPGIKLENATTRPRVKRRSQFRIASRNLGELYESFEKVDLLASG